MFVLPDPIWPVVVLAAISAIDGILCIKPAAFIAANFETVRWPRRLWWVMPPIKFTAAVGLVVGIWLPYLAAVTSFALVLYFVLAVAAHVRVRDFGRDLFVNATGMLLICVAVPLLSFIV